MPVNTLTDAMCKRAIAHENPLKLFDGHGLHLFVTPAGGKRWRMAYRLDGKSQTATFGPYPVVSLADARQRRDEVLLALSKKESPKIAKTRRSDALMFQSACETYWAGRGDVSGDYRDNALRGLQLHLWPALGATPVGQITREMLLEPLRRMDAAGKHVYVRRVRVWAGQVFDWAVEHGHAQSNPAAAIRPEKAFGRAPVESFAALELSEIPAFMERLGFEGDLQSALACKLLALTWVRTQELRLMRWADIDGDLWRVPKWVMKKRRDHLVPLSSQALALLDVLRERRNGELVFPAEHRNDRPISENAILALIARIGYRGRMTGHGWRSVASTWANEHEWNADAIERQLSHAPDDDVRAVYNRAEYLDIRRRMLQAWADWLLPA
jgi:integrase